MKTLFDDLAGKFFGVILTVLILGYGPVFPGDARAAEPELFYERLEEFHGHTCAGSLIGARLGFAARAALGTEVEAKNLRAEYFLLACPVDGVQMAAGTTLGNRGLVVHDQDKQRLVLSDIQTGRRVEANLTTKAVEQGQLYRELTRKARNSSAGSGDGILLEEIEKILGWFRSAAGEEVVIIRPLALSEGNLPTAGP